MDASGTFQNLIHQIQTSSLNFKIEMSPFSACITLKNSFIRDRKGKAVIPLKPHQENVRKIKPESDDTAKKLVDQESLITSLKKEYEVAVNECENLVEEKVKLENVVDILHSKLTAAVQQNADLSRLHSDCDKASLSIYLYLFHFLYHNHTDWGHVVTIINLFDNFLLLE